VAETPEENADRQPDPDESYGRGLRAFAETDEGKALIASRNWDRILAEPASLEQPHDES
jgi:hypothetical protein